ncbi:GIN domain-containing protein [Carboxylicivirga linearis]|uniref:DUF2807 domain-containing protein n=1 Tax=Carboxylicivirga linearis TaxID=1628157 RepID=A0ABS5JV63_9BACT|nr:DUF2807 domain-containing protein [Carboxylicivirga linearis]MBS2098808.1 DUF2807 domain-containing protein [Carboxylicivirga linearis]
MKVIGIIVLVCFFVSCNSKECDCVSDSHIVVGEGEVITKTFDVESFSGVSALSFTDIRISTGQEQLVQVSGQENIMDLLSVKVENGTLDLSFPNDIDIRPTEDLTAEIKIPGHLNALSFVGLAEIELKGELQEYVAINITGSANLNSLDLPVNGFVLNWVGEGTAKVWSIEQLILNCTGVFDVQYKGEPTITNNSTGTVTVGPIQ